MEIYKSEAGQFINSDCLDAMKGIPDGSVDMVLCDLPYGTTKCKWDNIIPFYELWNEYCRICNESIVLSSMQPFTSKLITSQIELYRYSWIWEKTKGTNFMSAKLMPLLKTEDISVFSKKTCNSMSKQKMLYNPQNIIKTNKTLKNSISQGGQVAKARNAIFEPKKEYKQEYTNYPNNILRISNDEDAFHPTQKPVALFEYLIKTYTNEGDTVLDNCAGSGTTAIAAINTNRKWICIEKDAEYSRLAVERIKAHQKPVDLFGGL